MAIELTEYDKTTLVPYGFKGEKITIAELVKTKEFKSLQPKFAENILNMIRDNPTIGILKGGGGRDETQVRNLFYSHYKALDKGISYDEYDSNPKMYAKIKAGKIKWNAEDSRWYQLKPNQTVVAAPGGSWHTGGYAVDFTGDKELAGRVGPDYGLEQITSTGEDWHFQPAGMPASKKMYELIKQRFGVDAVETPLPKEIVKWLDKEVASNVPKHPERVMKKLGKMVTSWRDTGSFPKPEDVNDEGKVRRTSVYITPPISSSSTSTTSVPKTTTTIPSNATQPGTSSTSIPKSTTTTVPKSTTTTVKPTTTTTRPSTTTTVKPTTTTSPKTTTTTVPKTTTTTTEPPAKQSTPEAQKTSDMASWVIKRSNELVKSGMKPAAADRQALKEVKTKFGADTISTPPTTIAPKGATTTTGVPTTTTTIPTGTTTTTVAPAGPQAVDLEGPNAVKNQYDALVKAKWDAKKKLWTAGVYGTYTDKERTDALKVLKSRLPVVSTGSTGPTLPAKPTKTVVTPTGPTATVDGKTVVVGGSKWQTIIQQEFGSLWDVYNSNADVHKVIDKSVVEGWYNDATKLTAALQNTNWFRTTQSSTRQYKIRQATDPATLESDINEKIGVFRDMALKTGVVLPDASLRMLAENSIKLGWTTTVEFSNAIGSEAVAVAHTGGAQGVADLRKSSTGTSLRQIADNYGIKPTDTMLDQWVAEILQGTKTDAQFTDLMKQQASAQYRSLAPLIEKGQDVKTATSMYSNSAQSVLGIDPATIDWSQDKWNRALNYQDPKTGEYRQMDSWEWNRYLRQQPEWQNTDDAKSIYRNAAFSLAQAFGKTT